MLQAGEAQIDRLKAASQEIVLEVLDIIGGGEGGGVETPGLGLVKEVIDEMDKLAAGLGNFGDHGFCCSRISWSYESPLSHSPVSPSCKAVARDALGDGSEKRRPWFSSGEIPRAAAAGFFDRQAQDKNGGRHREGVDVVRDGGESLGQFGARSGAGLDTPVRPCRCRGSRRCGRPCPFRSEATKKMMTPVEGATSGSALSVAMKPAAFAT